MKLTALVTATVLALSMNSASAQEYRDGIDDSPSAAAMAADLLIIRPVSLVATVAGVGLFVLFLPLSIIQGEPPLEPAHKLIVEPAKFTFTRRLGSMEFADLR